MNKPDKDPRYKFLDLKIYAETEWLADNRKKYRQVFQEKELSYIYVELSIVNRLYEVDAWEVPIKLVCYQLGAERKSICSIEVIRQISEHDHIAYIREGWGNKNIASFWKPGKYCWVAYLDEQKLMTKYFYVEELHKVFTLEQYCNALYVRDIEFYEGASNDNETLPSREYFQTFSATESRYVFAEISLENKYDYADWHAEIFVRYYNQGRELKGEIVKLQKIMATDVELVISLGWGSNIKGAWRKGHYRVEVVFQDEMIGESMFTIDDNFEKSTEDLPDFFSNREELIRIPVDYKSARQSFKELNQLIGLNKVKQQLSDHSKYIKFLQLRLKRGFNDDAHLNLHSVFIGNPGTGKTTIARLLGSIYREMGLLERGHVHEVDRVDLVGEFIGQTAPKVKEAFLKAAGGVLFIDEAYALVRSTEDTKDFGREVIELLVKEMGNPQSKFMVIAAGYPEEMENFISSNPGLRSRFKYIYEFEDFSVTELFSILDTMCLQNEVMLTASAKSLLEQDIQEAYRMRDRSFGNARFVSSLLEKAKINMGIRLMRAKDQDALSDEELSTITLRDIQLLSRPNKQVISQVGIHEELLQTAIRELDAMIGLGNVKKQVKDLVEVIKYKLIRGQLTTSSVNMHTVLLGNPGTGKTTVTRILSRIFHALGILERGHIVETDRQGLIAGYVGQTAIKTSKVIDSAQGGVLFIDEAYSLIKPGALNDFGDEAIQVLLKKMEDLRGKFFVFVAGYPQLMRTFMESNPGLQSRFDLTLFFEDFTHDELGQIALSLIQEKKLRIGKRAVQELKAYLKEEYLTKKQGFGNARRVRQIVNELLAQQQLRVGKEKVSANSSFVQLVKLEDVQNCIVNLKYSSMDLSGRRRIGY